MRFRGIEIVVEIERVASRAKETAKAQDKAKKAALARAAKNPDLYHPNGEAKSVDELFALRRLKEARQV